MIILYKISLDTGFLELSLLIAFQKKAPLIRKNPRLDEQYLWDVSENNIQNMFPCLYWECLYKSTTSFAEPMALISP